MEAVIGKTHLERYTAYKDSGVEWLENVPVHWEVVSLGSILEFKSDKNHPDYEVLSVYREYGVIPKDSRDDNHNATSLDTKAYKAVEPGDLVVNKMKAWQGSMGISAYKGIVSPAYITCKVTSKNIDAKFLHQMLRCNSYIKEYNRLSYGVRVGQWDMHFEDFKRITILLPPKEEQTAISAFLDRKTALIEKAIGIKEKQIALLKERRQILIHNAVTRGLDPNVKMKDSGVEWIAEIPEHWEVKFLRYIGKCQNGLSKGAEYFGSGFPFVSYGDVYKSTTLPQEVNNLANSTEADRQLYSVKDSDVFFTRTSETVDEIAFASTCLQTIVNATFSGFLIRFRPEKDIIKKEFSKYYFSSKTHRAFFIKEMNLVIRASLSQELLKKMPVLIPPAEEQDAISIYLDRFIDKTYIAILNKEKEIQKLKEYKSTLINSAVTGKIKVI